MNKIELDIDGIHSTFHMLNLSVLWESGCRPICLLFSSGGEMLIPQLKNKLQCVIVCYNKFYYS